MLCVLVDDDLDDQEIFQLCIEEIRPDIQTLIFNNGVEVLQKLKEDNALVPDVIFLDVNMPKMNGLECLKYLKEIPRLTSTCIFIYSTTSELAAVKKAKELGASEYIVKLANTVELKNKLSQVLANCSGATKPLNDK